MPGQVCGTDSTAVQCTCCSRHSCSSIWWRRQVFVCVCGCVHAQQDIKRCGASDKVATGKHVCVAANLLVSVSVRTYSTIPTGVVPLTRRLQQTLLCKHVCVTANLSVSVGVCRQSEVPRGMVPLRGSLCQTTLSEHMCVADSVYPCLWVCAGGEGCQEVWGL